MVTQDLINDDSYYFRLSTEMLRWFRSLNEITGNIIFKIQCHFLVEILRTLFLTHVFSVFEFRNGQNLTTRFALVFLLLWIFSTVRWAQ